MTIQQYKSNKNTSTLVELMVEKEGRLTDVLNGWQRLRGVVQYY